MKLQNRLTDSWGMGVQHGLDTGSLPSPPQEQWAVQVVEADECKAGPRLMLNILQTPAIRAFLSYAVDPCVWSLRNDAQSFLFAAPFYPKCSPENF